MVGVQGRIGVASNQVFLGQAAEYASTADSNLRMRCDHILKPPNSNSKLS
eukprot:m.10089 g.10089  ORF g.10089 m.10089 type:complete len:50 (+) comp9580_c0_seq1:982-1131(+)